jgi:hypothetical protein
MSDLTSSVLAQLDSSHINAIARQLGVSPDQAGQAVQQALPLLLGGLARNQEPARQNEFEAKRR